MILRALICVLFMCLSVPAASQELTAQPGNPLDSLRGLHTVRVVVIEDIELASDIADTLKATIARRLRQRRIEVVEQSSNVLHPVVLLDLNVMKLSDRDAYGAAYVFSTRLEVNQLGDFNLASRRRLMAPTWQRGLIGFVRPPQVRQYIGDTLETLLQALIDDHERANTRR